MENAASEGRRGIEYVASKKGLKRIKEDKNQVKHLGVITFYSPFTSTF